MDSKDTSRTLLLVADLVYGVEQPRLPSRRRRLLVRHDDSQVAHLDQHWGYHCTLMMWFVSLSTFLGTVCRRWEIRLVIIAS